jgi:FXSXX-COOH protein
VLGGPSSVSDLARGGLPDNPHADLSERCMSSDGTPPVSDVETTVIDLSGLDLADLANLDGDVFGESLRRLLTGAARPDQTLAGFQSSI